MKRLFRLKTRFFRSEDGPTGTEYAVLLGVISLTVIGAMSTFGEGMSELYVIINGTLSVF